MADNHTSEQRRQNMRRIRSTETVPEKQVRRIAHALSYRFRLWRKGLPGTPDLVFPGRRKVIFVHGCFWHQHPGCQRARLPQSRQDYWHPKLKRNVARDIAVLDALDKLGWHALCIWECQTRDPSLVRALLRSFLDAPPPTWTHGVQSASEKHINALLG